MFQIRSINWRDHQDSLCIDAINTFFEYGIEQLNYHDKRWLLLSMVQAGRFIGCQYIFNEGVIAFKYTHSFNLKHILLLPTQMH